MQTPSRLHSQLKRRRESLPSPLAPRELQWRPVWAVQLPLPLLRPGTQLIAAGEGAEAQAGAVAGERILPRVI